MAERDLNSLERDIEQTREQLATTIDQLLHRSNPKTIARREADQVRGFFMDTSGAPRQDNIVKVAVGVASVVVVFAVIRKIVRD